MIKGPPQKLVFADVETTGVHSNDRIVSIGLIQLDIIAALRAELYVNALHLVFDPCKKSHPAAERVHGLDDWMLRHQDKFCDHAAMLHEFVTSNDLIVAHNAAFDLKFIEREFSISGISEPKLPPSYCTMHNYRQIGGDGSAALAAIAKRIGLEEQSEHHSALQDAWLCMQIYLYLHASPLYRIEFSRFENPGFANLKPHPPRPSGPLPRRSNRRPTAKER